MNADGSNQVNLTNNPGKDWFPFWSPTDNTDYTPTNDECVNTKLTATDTIGSFTVTASESNKTINLKINGKIDKHEVKNSEELQFVIFDPNCNPISDDQIDNTVSVDPFGEFNENIQVKEIKSGPYTIHGTYSGKSIGSKEFTVISDFSSPTPDADKDGISDDLDACPQEPEDLDGVEDKDGCPESDGSNGAKKSKITLSLDSYVDTITIGDKIQTNATVKMISGEKEERISLSCKIESSDVNHGITCESSPEQLVLHPDDSSKDSLITIKTEPSTEPKQYILTIMAKNDVINAEPQKFELEDLETITITVTEKPVVQQPPTPPPKTTTESLEPVVEQEPDPLCGPGTELQNGICVVIEKEEPSNGTELLFWSVIIAAVIGATATIIAAVIKSKK